MKITGIIIRFSSISETRNILRPNETLLLQLDGIKTDPIQTQKASGFGDTVSSKIKNDKVGDNIDHNAEKIR